VVLFALAAKNFNEERLFSEKKLLPRVREFLSSILPQEHPYAALFILAILSIPFVFMAQMMGLVIFFNLPMPYSLVLLLVLAAFIEELAKAVGIYTLFARDPAFFSWKNLVLACAAIAIGFLVGEKLLLFATLAQITQSVFGSVLFLSLGVLWMPLLLHFVCVLVVACSLKLGGRRPCLRKDDPARRPAPGLHRALLIVPDGRAHLHVRPGGPRGVLPFPVRYRVRGQRNPFARVP
jgi:RsiW-degrading membrane proteinase PrsW (M82 family)